MAIGHRVTKSLTLLSHKAHKVIPQTKGRQKVWVKGPDYGPVLFQGHLE